MLIVSRAYTTYWLVCKKQKQKNNKIDPGKGEQAPGTSRKRTKKWLVSKQLFIGK